MVTFADALKQKNILSPALLERPDVQGIGVGYADPGMPAKGAAVIVYTDKASAPGAIGHMVRTMSTVHFPLRYISTGVFKPSLASANIKVNSTMLCQRIRPVPAGVSIGMTTHGTGTGGLIVTRNKKLYLLTNNHILIPQHGRHLRELLQPGPADGGKSSKDGIGRPYQYVALQPKGSNYMDAAIAKPFSNAGLNPKYLASKGRGLIVPGHVEQYRVGERLMKSGRTTGWITGIVEAVNVDIRIRYGSLGKVLFRNQSVITGRTGAGDSGSVWLRQQDKYAAALHFAGDGFRSISTPIGHVLSVFGLRVAVALKSGGFKKGFVKKASRPLDAAYVRPLSAAQRKRARAIFVY